MALLATGDESRWKNNIKKKYSGPDGMPGPVKDFPGFDRKYEPFDIRQVVYPEQATAFGQQRANRAASNIQSTQSSATGRAIAQGGYGSTAAALAGASQEAANAGRMGELARDEILLGDMDRQYATNLDNANLGYQGDALNLGLYGQETNRDRAAMDWNGTLMDWYSQQEEWSRYRQQQARVKNIFDEIQQLRGLANTPIGGGPNDIGDRLASLYDELAALTGGGGSVSGGGGGTHTGASLGDVGMDVNAWYADPNRPKNA